VPNVRSSELRIAILPVRSLGRDGFGFGLAESLIVALSRFHRITCLDATRSSVNLDADYQLATTVQCSDSIIRIFFRLDQHQRVVWSQRRDCELDDVFALQNEIAGRVAAQIDSIVRLDSNPMQPTAANFVRQAVSAIHRLHPTTFHEAGNVFAKALTLEPDNASAHVWWAFWHLLLVGQGWATDRSAAIQRAGALADRSVRLGFNDAELLSLAGHIRSFLYKRPEEARDLQERAVDANPNLPLAWSLLGAANTYLGRYDEAVTYISRAQSLSPHDPLSFFLDNFHMMALAGRGDFAAGAAVGRRALALNPWFSSTYKGYLSALGHVGDDAEATRVSSRLYALEPNFTIASTVQRTPMRRTDDLAVYAEGLRRAGLRP
jgi:TolB-like protein/Flp pilus assembly protein TadD